MKMKRAVSVVLAAVCVMSMAACGGKKEAAQINKIEDLKGKKVGVQLGTTGDLYASDDKDLAMKVERFDKGFEAVQALKQGKVDAVIIDNQPAQVFLEQTKGLKLLESAYAEEEYAFCFQKGNELCAQVNDAMKELKADGTFDKIVASYIGETAGKNYYESPADTAYTNGTLVMATNAEFPPYEFREGDKIVGIDADFAKAIADKLGMELKIEDMKFDAIIAAVNSGKADFGAAGMTVTEDRLKQADFSDTYYKGIQSIIVKDTGK